MLSIQDLDHPFLAEAIQGRPFELHSVVAGFIFVIPRDFIQGPSRLVDCWLICSMSQTVFFFLIEIVNCICSI